MSQATVDAQTTSCSVLSENSVPVVLRDVFGDPVISVVPIPAQHQNPGYKHTVCVAIPELYFLKNGSRVHHSSKILSTGPVPIQQARIKKLGIDIRDNVRNYPALEEVAKWSFTVVGVGPKSRGDHPVKILITVQCWWMHLIPFNKLALVTVSHAELIRFAEAISR